MKKSVLFILLLLGASGVQAQDGATDLSEQEAAAVAAILAKENAPAPEPEPAEKIILPETTKAQALAEAEAAAPLSPAAAEEEAEEPVGYSGAKCLPVAFVDIDEAFNAHPRTVAVKAQINEKILAKEQEVQQAKEQIKDLQAENARLAQQLRALKPFYERIVIEPHPLLPQIAEHADSVELENVLNRLTYARVEVLSESPLNTPAELSELRGRIAANKAAIEQKELFIDTYKYTTREEILALEQKVVDPGVDAIAFERGDGRGGRSEILLQQGKFFLDVHADGVVWEEAEGGVCRAVGHDYAADGPAFALVVAEHHRHVFPFVA